MVWFPDSMVRFIDQRRTERYAETGTRPTFAAMALELLLAGMASMQGGQPAKRRRAEPAPRPARPSMPTTAAPDPDRETAERIARWWMEQLPLLKGKADDQRRLLPSWVRALTELRRIDGHPWSRIEAIVKWVVADRDDDARRDKRWPGWFYNLQSPLKFRKRNKDGIMYFDVIAEKARTPAAIKASDPIQKAMENRQRSIDLENQRKDELDREMPARPPRTVAEMLEELRGHKETR